MIGSIVLKPGPARRVDLGPGQPRLGTGSGLSKNPSRIWPGETRRVDPEPGRPRQTRLRPDLFFFLYIYIHSRKWRRSFWPFKMSKVLTQNDVDEGCKIADRDNKKKQFQSHNSCARNTPPPQTRHPLRSDPYSFL